MLPYILSLMICIVNSQNNPNSNLEQNFHYIGKYNYEQANKECSKHGWALVRVKTKKSAKSLYNFAVTVTKSHYWIDANYIISKKVWLHNDGTPLTNDLWHKDEPNNLENEQCAIGNWKESDFKLWSYYCTEVVDTFCEQNFHYIGKYNYEQANKECSKHGWALVRVETKKSAKSLYNFAVTVTKSHYWIDANYIISKKVWLHNDGTPLTNDLWQKDEPNNLENEQCAIGNWKESDFKLGSYFCTEVVDTFCEQNFHYIGKYKYEQANEECSKRGLSLVRAETEKSAESLYNFAVTVTKYHYWIDAKYFITKNVWRHYDGSPATTNVWYKNSPNNLKEEQCAIGNWLYKGFKWWNYYCDESVATICDRRKSIKKGFHYFGEYNYEEANKECLKHGLTLVRAETEKSAKSLYDFVIKVSKFHYWIDANNISNKNVWLHYDGSPATTNLWYQNEPRNLENEKCVIGNWKELGFKWWNYFCTEVAATICETFCEGNLKAFNTFYVINNGSCYYPKDSDSMKEIMTKPRTYERLQNNLLLLRIVAGSNIKSYEYYTSNITFNDNVREPYNKDLNYKSPLLQEWRNVKPKIMNVTIKDNARVVAWLTFNVKKGDTLESWFSQDHLVASYPWNVALLKSGNYNYFNICKTIFKTNKNLNHHWNQCPGVAGVMMVMDMKDDCDFIPGINVEPPKILYTVVNKYTGAIMGNAMYGKYFEIWATYEDNIIIMA